MPLSDPSQIRDHSLDFLEFWHQRRRQEIRELITPELLAEHRADPDGEVNRHSGDLMRVLNYLRSIAGSNKEFIFPTVPFREYQIGKLHGRGAPADLSNPERFSSEDEVVQRVFLLRLEQADLLPNELNTDQEGRTK